MRCGSLSPVAHIKPIETVDESKPAAKKEAKKRSNRVLKLHNTHLDSSIDLLSAVPDKINS